jgi:Protein of unknown function/GLTT repeat (6 copies)
MHGRPSDGPAVDALRPTQPRPRVSSLKSIEMAQCGDSPRFLAIGIAPLGIVSIGVVPMGVVSIGVVPMGVISLGVVGMGVINACVVGMGVLVAGVHGMGIWQLGPEGLAAHRHGQAAAGQHVHQPARAAGGGGSSARTLYAYATKAEALAKSRELGCQGVHAMGALWMPCGEHPR